MFFQIGLLLDFKFSGNSLAICKKMMNIASLSLIGKCLAHKNFRKYPIERI